VRESLAARQQSDPELGKLVRLRHQSAEQPALALLSSESESAKKLYNQWERLEVQEWLVRRRVEGKPGDKPYMQLLVPRQSVQDVLHCCHEGMTGGHFGIRRTLDQVQRRFYWLTWNEDTIRFCERCEPCNEYHRGKLRRTGPLQPVIAGAPYIDLTGPHPRPERRHVYILTCVNAFKEAEPIAKVLVEQVFCRFGTPVTLLSDQGKEVDGNIMKHVCRMLGINKLRTTPSKPSTNQVERLHRSINAILGKTVASHQKDWDTRLSFAMSAYRASRHESTGYTPNMLTLGTEIRAPADIMYGSLNEPSTETSDDYVESMRERMTTAYEEARAALRKTQRYYDVRVRAKEYRKGQWVYYFSLRKFVGHQDKRQREYTGPFLIVGTPSPVTVQLQIRKGAKTMTVHIDKVKPFLGEVPKSWLAGEPSSDDRELPGRADDEQILVKALTNEPNSEQMYVESANDELISEPEPEEDSVFNTDINYEVDRAEPLERPRRKARAPKYLGEYVRPVAAKEQRSY